MPPTLKKLKGHIALGLSIPPVSASFQKKNKLRFLNFINGFLIKKIIDLYFFLVGIISLSSYGPFKGSDQDI